MKISRSGIGFFAVIAGSVALDGLRRLSADLFAFALVVSGSVALVGAGVVYTLIFIAPKKPESDTESDTEK